MGVAPLGWTEGAGGGGGGPAGREDPAEGGGGGGGGAGGGPEKRNVSYSSRDEPIDSISYHLIGQREEVAAEAEVVEPK